MVRLRVHRRSAHPVAEGQDSCPDQQVVAAATQGRVGPAQPDHARLVQLLQICRRQERYAILAIFVWHRIARWWLRLHRWSWADLRRHLIGPNGRWRMPSADGVALFNLGRVPTARYRYRGNKIPNPWTVANPCLTAETVESPVRGDAHAGFGERPAETDRWQHRHRAARADLNHPGAQLRFTDIDGMRITAFITDTAPAAVPGQLAGWNYATASTPALRTASAKPKPPAWPTCPATASTPMPPG